MPPTARRLVQPFAFVALAGGAVACAALSIGAGMGPVRLAGAAVVAGFAIALAGEITANASGAAQPIARAVVVAGVRVALALAALCAAAGRWDGETIVAVATPIYLALLAGECWALVGIAGAPSSAAGYSNPMLR